MFSTPSSTKVIQVIFLGTGTSGMIPNIPCLTGKRPSCKTCLLAMTDHGRKNKRNNVSLLVRLQQIENSKSRIINVLIDAGKTFYESALSIFPRYGISQIDAVILTHGHADACFGLDNLWPFAANGKIPVYLTQETMDTVSQKFDYLVDSSNATGSGDVGAFEFRVLDPEEPFYIEGFEFMPLPVEHGIYHDHKNNEHPFMCMGYRFGDISYVSDTSRIPESTLQLMENSKIVILDCLHDEPHSSHFSTKEAVDTSRLLRPFKSYFVGFTHHIEHSELEVRLKLLEKTEGLRCSPAFDGLCLDFRQKSTIVEQSHFTKARFL